MSKGDNVILDEEEVTALVARKLYSEYSLFEGGKLISLTERDELKLGDVETFTNLLTLYAINKALKPLYHKQPRSEEREMVNVDALYTVACKFYDFVIENFPSLQDYFYGNLSLREARVNQKNLLFRPVGLVLLARLYAHAEITGSLSKLKRCASMFKFSSPGGHFERILITAGKIDGRDASKKAAYSMALHLLGDLSIEQQDELRQSLTQLTKDPNFKLPKPFPPKRSKSLG